MRAKDDFDTRYFFNKIILNIIVIVFFLIFFL